MLTLTPEKPTSQMLIQRTISLSELKRVFLNNEELSFSIDIKLISGNSSTRASIGIRFIDVDGVILYDKEEGQFTIDTSGLKYYINGQIQVNTVNIIVYLIINSTDSYLRIDFTNPAISVKV